jgi:type IV pilus assembly protein PilY1
MTTAWRSPRLVDINGDGLTDMVYAGDNQGNMWKFDLTSYNPANWKVAFGGSPLFTALGPAALNGHAPRCNPLLRRPPQGANDRKMELASAPKQTRERGRHDGELWHRAQRDHERPHQRVDVQTLYSVLDNTRYTVRVTTPLGKRLEVHPGAGTCPWHQLHTCTHSLGAGGATAKLAKRVFVEDGRLWRIKEVDELTKATWANWNGWYLDLPAVGERLLKPFDFYDSSNLLTVWSQVPAKGSNVDPNVESCESTSVDSERQYRTFINIMDGKVPSIQIVDKNKRWQVQHEHWGRCRHHSWCKT